MRFLFPVYSTQIHIYGEECKMEQMCMKMMMMTCMERMMCEMNCMKMMMDQMCDMNMDMDQMMSKMQECDEMMTSMMNMMVTMKEKC